MGFFRGVRGDQLLIKEGLPVEVLEPHMLFHLIGPIQAQPVRWFSLEAFIDEICCLQGPALGDLMFADLNLFSENIVPDVLPVLAVVGSL